MSKLDAMKLRSLACLPIALSTNLGAGAIDIWLQTRIEKAVGRRWQAKLAAEPDDGAVEGF